MEGGTHLMDEVVTVWALLVHNAVRIRFHFRSGQDKLVLRLLQLQVLPVAPVAAGAHTQSCLHAVCTLCRSGNS